MNTRRSAYSPSTWTGVFTLGLCQRTLPALSAAGFHGRVHGDVVGVLESPHRARLWLASSEVLGV